MTNMDDERQDGSTPSLDEPEDEPEAEARLEFFPSPWLMCYSLMLFFGGLYTFSIAVAPTTRFVAVCYIAAIVSTVSGIFLWLRLRIGLYGYVFLAIGALAFAGFRFLTDGFTTGRVGLVVGGLLMLWGIAGVSEEVPAKRS